MAKWSAQMFHTSAVLVLCWVGLLSAAECDTVRQEQEQCFSDLGISFLDMDNLVKHKKEVCLNQQMYSAAMRCALNVSQGCPSAMGPWSEKFLDDDQIAQGFSFFCNQMQVNPVKILPSGSRVRRDVCASTSSLTQAMVNCYTKEGIRFQALDISSTQTQESFTKSMFQSQETLRAVCNADIVVRQRATTCAFTLTQDCMPVEYKNYIQNPSQMTRLMEYLCNHYNEINFSCLKQKGNELYNCAYRKGLEIGSESSDLKYILCRVYPATVQCQNQVFPSCGCNTSRLYDKIAREYLNPTACSAITEPYPVCVPGAESYPYGGAVTSVSVLRPVIEVFVANDIVGAVSPLSASIVSLVLAAAMTIIFSG